MTIGSPRVGKTCLRYLLLGLPPPSVSDSTPVVKTAETVAVITPSQQLSDVDGDLAQRCSEKGRVTADLVHLTSEGGKDKWVRVNEASGLLSLLNLLKEDINLHSPAKTFEVVSSTEARLDERLRLPDRQTTSEAPMIPPTPEVKNRTKVAADGAGSGALDKQITLQEKAPLIPPVFQKPVPQDGTTIARQILQLLQQSDVQDIIRHDAKLLLFQDCGGQLAYHDILPLFTTISSIYLPVFNLTEDLNDYPTDRFRDNERELYSEARSPVTTAQMISRSLITIKSVSCKKANLPEEVIVNSSFEPSVMLVGTHLDEVEKKCAERAQTEKTLNEVSDTLWKELTSKTRDLEEMVLRNPTPPLPSMFFPVNNNLYVEEDEGQHSEISVCACECLRTKIKDQISRVKVKVPVKWYVFQLLEMSRKREGSKPVYKYSEFYQSCLKELAVGNLGEFHTMVTYFNALGLFVHLCGEDVEHTENSVCFIFTSPTYLSEIISKLYQVHFLADDRCEGGLPKLKRQGILTVKSLRDLHIDERHLKHRDLMDILVQLFIGAKIETGNGDEGMRIFIPSVLPAGGLSSTLHSELQESQLHFVFTFKGSFYIPYGVFTGVITHLQSAEEWDISLECLYRFHMRFSVGTRDFVSLSDCATHIKVVMEVKDEDEGKAQKYRDTILDAAAESYCFLFHGKTGKDHQSASCQKCSNLFLTLGLMCHPCKSEANHIAVLCVADGNPETVRCQETRAFKDLNVKQQLLFQNMKHHVSLM